MRQTGRAPVFEPAPGLFIGVTHIAVGHSADGASSARRVTLSPYMTGSSRSWSSCTERTQDGHSNRNSRHIKRSGGDSRSVASHADDAAVPAHQGGASRHARVLPDGRFLRAVFRRRRKSRAPARPHAHAARRIGRQSDQDGGRAVSRGRAIPREAREARRVGRDLRTDRRPGDLEGSGRTQGRARRHARHADRCRAALRQERRLSARAVPCAQPARRGDERRPRVAQSRERRAAPRGSRARRSRRGARAHPAGRNADRRFDHRYRRVVQRAGHRRDDARARLAFRRRLRRRSGCASNSTSRASTASARIRSPARAARRARCCSTPPRRRASNCGTCAASRSSTNPNTSGSIRPRGAISNSPKPCAAPNRRRSARCSTPAARRWAAACCATGCIIRRAMQRSRVRVSRRSARCSTRRRARVSTRCARRCGRYRTSNGSPGGLRCCRRGRAICRACATRSLHCPTLREQLAP